MMVVYIITGSLFFASVCCVIYQIISLFLWLCSPKIEAKIIDVIDETWNNNKIRLCYEFTYNGTFYRIWGPWYESLNPFISLFPKYKLGKSVFVRVNLKQQKIIQSPVVSLFFLIVSIFIIICVLFMWLII